MLRMMKKDTVCSPFLRPASKKGGFPLVRGFTWFPWKLPAGSALMYYGHGVIHIYFIFIFTVTFFLHFAKIELYKLTLVCLHSTLIRTAQFQIMSSVVLRVLVVMSKHSCSAPHPVLVASTCLDNLTICCCKFVMTIGMTEEDAAPLCHFLLKDV